MDFANFQMMKYDTWGNLMWSWTQVGPVGARVDPLRHRQGTLGHFEIFADVRNSAVAHTYYNYVVFGVLVPVRGVPSPFCKDDGDGASFGYVLM
jgi:hypothetical protein